MKEFLKATNQASYNWNLKENILELSDEWFEITGMDEASYQVTNQEWARRIHPDDCDPVRETLDAHFRGETKWFQVVYRYWSDTKKWIWIEDCGQVVERDQSGNPVRMMGFNRDVTKAMVEKQELMETNELPQLAADVSNLWVYCVSVQEHRVRFHSGATGKDLLFGKPEMTFHELLSYVVPDEQEMVKNAFEQLSRKKKREVKLRLRILDQNRHSRWVEAIGRWSADGRIIGVIRDVDEEVRRMIELDRMANRDLMTGLFNRNVFERKLNGFSSTSGKRIIAVCDVDGLKILNDAFGHLMGDRMLRLFAMALDEVFCESELIVRIGGDEFAIIDSNSMEEMEEKFRDLKKRVENFDLPVQVGVSYGFTEMEAMEDPALAFKKAEDIMYRHKHLVNFKKRKERVEKLLQKMQSKDPLTHSHAERLQSKMKAFVNELPMEANEKREMLLLAQFHDIGKLNVSNRVLEKAGGLDHREKIEVKRHPEIGYRIARSLPELAGIAHEVLTHHERWDGKGYPLHLKGVEIPYKVRVMALFDYYDSVTHDRPYRPAIEKEEALRRIKRRAGKRFDPELTEKFIDFMKK